VYQRLVSYCVEMLSVDVGACLSTVSSIAAALGILCDILKVCVSPGLVQTHLASVLVIMEA
jgi:hypothetical protein